MKEKILSIVPEAILEEKHGIWFVSVPRTSFHDLALRLRNDEDTSFDFLVCMTGTCALCKVFSKQKRLYFVIPIHLHSQIAVI